MKRMMCMVVVGAMSMVLAAGCAETGPSGSGDFGSLVLAIDPGDCIHGAGTNELHPAIEKLVVYFDHNLTTGALGNTNYEIARAALNTACASAIGSAATAYVEIEPNALEGNYLTWAEAYNASDFLVNDVSLTEQAINIWAFTTATVTYPISPRARIGDMEAQFDFDPADNSEWDYLGNCSADNLGGYTCAE